MKLPDNTEMRRLAIQVVAWLAMALLPAAIMFAVTCNGEGARKLMGSEWYLIRNHCIAYFVNYCLLVPWLWGKDRKAAFLAVNVVLIVVLNLGMVRLSSDINELQGEVYYGYMSGVLLYGILQILSIIAAVAVRYYYHTNDLKRRLAEERHKSTEAELAWLKWQLNPHFLFNTLNNISGLVRTDADKAQDSIAQLSDLMRYAVYDTNRKTVPVADETAFLNNYIDLMKLRLGSNAHVETHFRIERNVPVAPLLFITPVENAFKHGISSSRPSMVKISMESDDNGIRFTCCNTNYPKTNGNRSGSGIGLPNLERRLKLLYPDNYSYEHGVRHDDATGTDIYQTTITIRP